ncbi:MULTISPECIES: hypothetical protein [Pseudobacillus]|uniref:hypothetical protein n=1 Tax=Pseudobacillus TaxID=108525 RepID=UPI003879E0AB
MKQFIKIIYQEKEKKNSHTTESDNKNRGSGAINRVQRSFFALIQLHVHLKLL